MEFKSKFIERDFAISMLQDIIGTHSRTPVEQGENEAYRLGHHLGYTDGLNHALSMLKDLPEAKKPDPPEDWHRR